MKNILTTGWSVMRVLRIVIGIWALAFALRDHDVLTGIAGAFILFTGVMNTGCCAMGSCSTGYQSHGRNKSEMKNEAVYKEMR